MPSPLFHTGTLPSFVTWFIPSQKRRPRISRDCSAFGFCHRTRGGVLLPSRFSATLYAVETIKHDRAHGSFTQDEHVAHHVSPFLPRFLGSSMLNLIFSQSKKGSLRGFRAFPVLTCTPAFHRERSLLFWYRTNARTQNHICQEYNIDLPKGITFIISSLDSCSVYVEANDAIVVIDWHANVHALNEESTSHPSPEPTALCSHLSQGRWAWPCDLF